MTQAELRVSILADISQLERALTAAEKMLVQHQQNYDSVSSSISQAASRMREIGRAAQNLRSAFNAGKISADQFEKEMGQLNKEVRQLDVAMSDLTREQTRLGREMQRTTRTVQQQRGGFAGVAGGAKQASQGMQQMSRTATVNAVPAMTSVSHIIQDMPYGIQGVANNIQQLTMQMGWLTTQAGGTKNAFRELVGSLWGPAGILLAVSVVTSALVKYGHLLTGADSLTKQLSKSTSELVGSVKSEISTLNALLSVARNVEESTENRQRAIDNINDRYGEYLGNLDLESINTNKVTTAVDNLSKALIRQAKIRGVQELISKKAGEIAEKEAEAYEKAQKRIEEAQGQARVTERETDPRLKPTGDEAERIENAVEGARDKLESSLLNNALQEAAKDAKAEYGELNRYLQKLIGEDIELKGVFTDVTGGKGVESAEDLLKRLGIDSDQLQDELDLESMIFDLDEFEAQINAASDRINKTLNDAFTLYNTTNIDDALGLASLSRSLQLAESNFYGFGEAVDDTVVDIEVAAEKMARSLEMAINGMIRDMIRGEFKAEDFARNVLASLATLAVSSALGIGGSGGLLSGLFGGGAQASVTSPQISTASATRSIGSGAQMGIAVEDIRIDGQDLLVVMGRASQNRNRVG